MVDCGWELQSWPKYIGQTVVLVLVRSMGKLQCQILEQFFACVDKVFIFIGRLGYNSMKIWDLLNIS